MKDTAPQCSKPAHLLCCTTLLKQYCTSSISTNQCVSARQPMGRLKTLIYTDKQGGKKSPDRMSARVWLRECFHMSLTALKFLFKLTITDIHHHWTERQNDNSCGLTKKTGSRRQHTNAYKLTHKHN